MGEWEPDQQLKVESRDAYVWIVPANVVGTWQLKDDRGSFSGTLNLSHALPAHRRHARAGSARRGSCSSAWMEGDKLGFSFVDSDNHLAPHVMRSSGVGRPSLPVTRHDSPDRRGQDRRFSAKQALEGSGCTLVPACMPHQSRLATQLRSFQNGSDSRHRFRGFASCCLAEGESSACGGLPQATKSRGTTPRCCGGSRRPAIAADARAHGPPDPEPKTRSRRAGRVCVTTAMVGRTPTWTSVRCWPRGAYGIAPRRQRSGAGHEAATVMPALRDFRRKWEHTGLPGVPWRGIVAAVDAFATTGKRRALLRRAYHLGPRKHDMSPLWHAILRARVPWDEVESCRVGITKSSCGDGGSTCLRANARQRVHSAPRVNIVGLDWGGGGVDPIMLASNVAVQSASNYELQRWSDCWPR
jgi:hypothetical protein